MNEIIIHPIGTIFTPHLDVKNMPIQPIAAKGVKGYIEIFEEYSDGLKDLVGFSHITLVYHFHKIDGYELTVTPFMDTEKHCILPQKLPKDQMQ